MCSRMQFQHTAIVGFGAAACYWYHRRELK
jgi:hypothetical protein